MKKIVLAAMIAVMSVSASMAQVRFGAKVGFDITNFWGSDVKHGVKPAYQAGVLLEYRFAGSKFALAPEVVFAAQGGHYNKTYSTSLPVIGNLTGEYKYTYNTNYINIPVMLKYYVTPDFAIDFGPQLGINVYSKVTYEAKAQEHSKEYTTDIKDNTNSVDFALGLGATYNLTDNAFLQARYTMGLTKAFDSDYSNVIGDAKNGNIQISFGYKF